MCVQQPIRVGFSQASADAPDITSEVQVKRDMRSFLTSFFTVFKELADLPVYISGESYAGFYIPWIADHLLRTQENGHYDRWAVSPSGTSEGNTGCDGNSQSFA